MVAIGLDLGGTAVKSVVIDQDGRIRRQMSKPLGQHATVNDEWNWKKVVKDTFDELYGEFGKEVGAVGMSAPGIANAENTAIFSMPGRFYGLERFIWSDYLGHKTQVINDAHSALMAEVQFGAARGYKHVVLLTLGTGIGGGILIDGKLHQGFNQMAGHLGHITVDADNSILDIFNIPGSLEDMMGNATVEQRSYGRYKATHELEEAYRAGDPVASYIWLSSIRKLAIGMCSLINAVSPEVFILGGGISQAGDSLLKPLEGFMALHEWRPNGKGVPVLVAQFGEYAGAAGAAGFALRQL
jgi:glucokinase